MSIPEIPKEDLKTQIFLPAQERPSSVIAALQSRVRKAVSLGNLHKCKCELIVRTAGGLRRVSTTLWGFDGRYVWLKGGVTIAFSCIEDIVV